MRLLVVSSVLLLGAAFAQTVGTPQYVEQVDPIDQVDTSSVVLESDDGLATFVWFCRPNDDGQPTNPSIGITTQQYLGDETVLGVDYRVDGFEASHGEWLTSTDGTGASTSQHYSVFTLSNLQADSFFVRIQDHQGTRYTYSFSYDPSVLKEALGNLSCGAIPEMVDTFTMHRGVVLKRLREGLTGLGVEMQETTREDEEYGLTTVFTLPGLTVEHFLDMVTGYDVVFLKGSDPNSAYKVLNILSEIK